MKRIVFAVCAMLMALSLSGCMTPQQWAYVKQPQLRPDLVQKTKSDDYIRQHPLKIGMSIEDMEALYGDMCRDPRDSSSGTFYSCHFNAFDSDDVTTVLVDNDGKVASWLE